MNGYNSPCRYCDSAGHHRSRLRLFDWPLYALGFVPVRCKNCGARSYRHRWFSGAIPESGPELKDNRLN
jgi:hypothetical protein